MSGFFTNVLLSKTVFKLSFQERMLLDFSQCFSMAHPFTFLCDCATGIRMIISRSKVDASLPLLLLLLHLLLPLPLLLLLLLLLSHCSHYPLLSLLTHFFPKNTFHFEIKIHKKLQRSYLEAPHILHHIFPNGYVLRSYTITSNPGN